MRRRSRISSILSLPLRKWEKVRAWPFNRARIVEEHKGTISVSSKPGKGAVFKISFPCAERKDYEKVESAREIIRGRVRRS